MCCLIPFDLSCGLHTVLAFLTCPTDWWGKKKLIPIDLMPTIYIMLLVVIFTMGTTYQNNSLSYNIQRRRTDLILCCHDKKWSQTMNISARDILISRNNQGIMTFVGLPHRALRKIIYQRRTFIYPLDIIIAITFIKRSVGKVCPTFL